jgi:hypothetical protein
MRPGEIGHDQRVDRDDAIAAACTTRGLMSISVISGRARMAAATRITGPFVVPTNVTGWADLQQP